MTGGEPTILRGQARGPTGGPAPTVVTLGAADFSVAVGGAAPWQAAYRDIVAIADSGLVTDVSIGADDAAERWSFEHFGSTAGALTRGLRDGRFRQWLTDGLVEIGDAAPIEVVEVSMAGSAGPAQLLYHDRGVAIAPLDERQARQRIRRAGIGAIVASPERGALRVESSIGPIELGRVGPAATSHERRWASLRDAAATDSATIVGGLIPDAPFDIRRRAAAALPEGQPADAAGLGAAWEPLERAVLTDATFAASYRLLVERAGGPSSRRWLAIAPEAPGRVEQPRIWFLVGLPGNLVALELVSEGAHATYLFRVAARATFVAGSEEPAALDAAVREISDALVDARFLREPLALPDARLAGPDGLRYRLALRALPSLAAARARFVARLIHRDEVGWASALDDLIGWHGSVRDDAADWPGRLDQESQVAEVGADPS